MFHYFFSVSDWNYLGLSGFGRVSILECNATVCEVVSGADVCLFLRSFALSRVFARKRTRARVNAQHSKVEDGADSLCAVYYRILCNYIITANHPPEVA